MAARINYTSEMYQKSIKWIWGGWMDKWKDKLTYVFSFPFFIDQAIYYEMGKWEMLIIRYTETSGQDVWVDTLGVLAQSQK